MHNDHASGPRRDLCLHGGRIQTECIVDIRQDRDCPEIYDGCHYGNPHIGRHDDFLTRPDTERSKSGN